MSVVQYMKMDSWHFFVAWDAYIVWVALDCNFALGWVKIKSVAPRLLSKWEIIDSRRERLWRTNIQFKQIFSLNRYVIKTKSHFFAKATTLPLMKSTSDCLVEDIEIFVLIFIDILICQEKYVRKYLSGIIYQGVYKIYIHQ